MGEDESGREARGGLKHGVRSKGIAPGNQEMAWSTGDEAQGIKSEHRGLSTGRAERTKHGRRDQSAEREAQGTDRLGKARGTKHVGRPVSRGSNQVLATRADAPLNAAQRTQDGEPCHSMRGCVAQRDHAATVEGGLVDATQMRPGSSNGWTDAASGDAAPTQNTVGPNCLWPRRFPATGCGVASKVGSHDSSSSKSEVSCNHRVTLGCHFTVHLLYAAGVRLKQEGTPRRRRHSRELISFVVGYDC